MRTFFTGVGRYGVGRLEKPDGSIAVHDRVTKLIRYANEQFEQFKKSRSDPAGY